MDTAEQAVPFDPTTATREQVDAERARERRVRADQADRISVELAKRGLDYAAIVARHVTTDTQW